tara:strand:- start:229 stop:450 length:222 start_codon:yes stop_codon:yes gene_type:complete
MKIGDLVKFVPDPSAVFKWEKYRDADQRLAPGIILEQVENSLSHTRRFVVRWNTGVVTEEWITYLENYDSSGG